jgi:hypothetical protein
MPQNFVTIQSTNCKILTQRTISKIWCVIGNDQQQIDVRWRSDGSQMDVEQKGRMIERQDAQCKMKVT